MIGIVIVKERKSKNILKIIVIFRGTFSLRKVFLTIMAVNGLFNMSICISKFCFI